jgi:dihydropyrimidinase
VAVTATNHAKTYGLYPQKGTIAVGADADIVLWDPDRRETITNANQGHGADYTPYEGLEVTGWPVLTMVRGRVVMRDGVVTGAKEHGRHVARGRSQRVPA